MNTQFKIRLFACISILSLMLGALGLPTQGALAANAGTALQFDGTTTNKQHVTFGAAPGLGVTSFTLEAWINRSATGGITMSTGSLGFDGAGGRPNGAYPVVTKGMGEGETPANVNMNYFLGITATGVVGADFEDKAGGVNHPIWGTTVVTPGQWHHIAVTYTGNCWALYLDGNAETMNGTACPNATPESISIQHAGLAAGLNSTGLLGAGFFSGSIDEARIWNRALPPGEISVNKSLELTSGSGLLARWGLNEGTGILVNSSVGSFTGTVKSLTTTLPGWVTGFPIPDGTPPAAPAGLLTNPYSGGISLTWTANTEPDLAGYNLYRSPTMGGPYTKVNISLITALYYADGGLTNGTPYYYVLRAVDTSNNESVNSNEANATPLAIYGSGLQFDGTNDYVTFGTASGLGVTDFTLETWFYWTGGGVATTTSGTQGLPTVIPLISKGRGEEDGTNKDMNYFLGVVPTTNKLAVDFEDMATGMNYPFTGNTTITTNEWHHAAVTYDSTSAVWSLYLDGILDSTIDLGSNILPRSDSIQHAGIGSAMTSTGTAAGYFQGSIDEARVWNRALPLSEIRANINSGLTSGTGLVARWGMNEGTGATIASSVGSFNGTLTNGPLWGTGAPFNLVFDTTPPAAPTNLMASPRPGAVQLEWTVNNEADLAGYRIYRSTSSPVVKGTPINGTLAGPSFMDSAVTAGITYYYAVVAVDTSNNESPLSNETSTIPLPPPPAEALDLGSSSAYVRLGDNADTPQFTLETWLRRDGAGVANTTGTGGVDLIPLIANGTADAETAAADINYIFGIQGSGVLCADFEEAQTGSSPGLNHPVCGTTPLQNDVWYHVAATYNGTIMRLYLNGNLYKEQTIGQPANTANTSQLSFGTSMKTDNTALGFFDGVLDEVRIWNYPRTQAQIASTINAKIEDPQTGLLGRWGLDEASGLVVNDTSGNTATGTIMGTGYSWVAGSPFNATVNLTPDAPVLIEPLNNASNVPTTATLSIDVTDPENSPLNVTFYGRPLQAAAGPDFTIVVIPDPQYYASTYPSIYNAQMQWVADNETSNNIVYVAGLGDNVDVASNTTQWTNADTAWDILDAGTVPYGIEAGNHDGAPSGTANFNTYFGSSRYAGKTYYGGHYGSDNDNHYALFEASGLKFIVIFIEYDDGMTATTHPVLTWANDLLQTHSDRRAIVVSHNMLQGGSSTTFSTQGQTIYNALKGNSNLFLMLGGHLDVAARRTDTLNGNSVYTLRSDYQSVDSQQSGYLRIMRFSPTDDMIYVRTYSPTQNKDYDKSDATQSNFNLPYSMDGTGFSVIGTANNVASGSTASIQWSGLNSAEQYEWFVIASDGTHQTSSDTWNFTTASAGNTPPVITEGDSENVAMSEDAAPTAFNLTLHATDANAGDTLSWGVSSPASNGTASVSGTGTSRVVSYIPNVNFNGSDSFVAQVSDGNGGTDSITVNVTVSAVNDAPVCLDVILTTPEDTSGEVAPSCTDIDNGDTLTYSIVAQPVHGSASVVNAKLNYISSANYSGPDSFTYRANDTHTNSNTATVGVTVTVVNDAPVLTNPGPQTNAENDLISLQIVAIDLDVPAQTLTYSAINLPDGLSINPSTGLISGTITFHAAAHTPFSVTVTVTDGVTPVQQNFTWNVTQAASGLCSSDAALVGCWPMEEGSGTVIIDATNFGNDGNLSGSPTWVTGMIDTSALMLNGTTQYATVPDSASLDITSQITIAAWVKPEQTTTQNLIKKAVNSNTNGYELSLAAAGSAANQKYFVRFNQTTSGDTYRVNSTTNYPADGTTWVHVAATYDGTTIKLYLNGVFNNSLTPTVPFTIVTNNLGLGIGADSTGGNKYKGAIDDARVYDRALNLAEIQALAGVTPPVFHTLTVSKTGTGFGTITSVPSGIDCGVACSYDFTENTLVTLTAVPLTGSTFSGWSGSGCTGTGTCVVTMTDAKSVTADFTLNTYALNISKTGDGSGTVTSVPTGIDCGITCSANFDYNASVALTAAPAIDSTFTGWSGACTGTGACNVTMTAVKSVTANFAKNTYTISGNTGLAGVTLSYIGGSTTSNGSGDYSFIVSSGWSGTVTPSLTGYTFTPASRTYNTVTSNQTIQDYSATPAAPPPSGLTCSNLQPKPATTGTGEKPQSKVWNYNNTWYAVFPTNASGASSAGTWLWKLDGTTWIEVLKLSDRTDVKADAKVSGNVAHILLYAGSNTQLVSAEFSGGTYQLWTTRPTASPLSLTGSEIATIEIDSTGRMWLATENDATSQIVAYYSDSPYSTWSSPITIASGINNDDISTIVKLSNKIGIFWSNQNTERFGFRLHNDGGVASTWAADELPASQSALNIGLGMSDDHLNLKVAADGTIYAAVKTSYDTAGYVKLALLVRRPAGTWDDLYEVDDAGTRGIVLLDEVNSNLTMIYTSSESYNPIIYKQSALQNINFGSRTTLRSGSFNDVSSTKGNTSGEFVVLYSSSTEVAGQLCAATPTSGADLSITKSDAKVTVRLNETSTYTITVTNNGPQAVSGATLADVLPSALTNAAWTCSAGGGASCAPSGTGNINDSVNLPVSGFVTYTLSAQVDLSARGTVVNTATVTAPVGISDPIPSNNSSTDTDTIVVNATACEADPTLVGCWPMEENGGSALIDGSSFTNDAGLYGSPAWVAGKVGSYALDLNGTSQYALVPDDASLDLTNNITISTWIKPEQYATQDVIKKATNGGINGYELSLATTKTDASSRKVFFRINQVASGDTYRINSTTEYPIDGTWMHVLATFDGTTMKLYINGILESSLTVPAGTVIATNTLPLSIGAQNDNTRWFMGWMDDARVYNRALSLAEIQSLAGIAPLTVNKAGTGSGTITSVPAGITCGITCVYNFSSNSLVTLTAAPALGSTFTGWSGAGCTGTGTCAVTMDTAKSVTANFELAEYTLTIVSAHGTVTKNPEKPTYHYGEEVTLSVVAVPGWSFADWTPSLTGNKVTITGNTTVTANYTQNAYVLTIVSAHGTVSPDKAGPYQYGDVVNLTATPDNGWTFANWTGDATGTTNTVSVTMNGDKSVTANYTQIEYTLTIEKVGNGNVTVNKVGPYHYGDLVELTATPDAHWAFSAWSGDLTSTVSPASITMDANKAVTATFILSNIAPVADGQTVGLDEDTSLNVILSATDADGDALTFAVVTSPLHGTYVGGVYTPFANYNGPDSFAFKANDGTADSNLAVVNITVAPVNDAPDAVDNNAQTTEGSLVLINVLANDTDVDGDVLSVISVGTPAHGSVVLNLDKTLKYTPAPLFNGTDEFTYTISDGNGGTDTAAVFVEVGPVNDPPVAGNDIYITNEDTQLSVPAPGVLANDDDPDDGDAITAVLVNTAQHGSLTLNPNGSFTYMPGANYTGSDTFTYKANDGLLSGNEATVTITINAVNDAPIAQAAAVSVDEDSFVGITLNATDVDGSTLTFNVVTPPAHGALSGTAPNLTYTPVANFNGTDGFTFAVSDGFLSSQAQISITVNPLNDAPVAVIDTFETSENIQLNIAALGVLANDIDVDGNLLTAALVGNVSHGLLTLNSDGSFTYMPDANYNGNDSFTYKANDGTMDGNVVTVTIKVNLVNYAPSAANDGYNTNEDTVLAIDLPGVLTNDTDTDGDTLTAVKVTDPLHGALNFHADGSFTYTPTLNWYGTDSFTYKTTDGIAQSNIAEVAILVKSINDAPTAAPQSVTTNEDAPKAIVLSGADLDGDALTYSIGVAPAHGVLSGTAPNLTYTPNAGFFGDDAFTFTVNDGQIASTAATISIKVNPINNAPICLNLNLVTDEDTPATLGPSCTDSDSTTLSYQIVGLPQHGTAAVSANLLSYSPNENYNGSDSFTYKANDGSLDSNIASVTVTVIPVADGPVITQPVNQISVEDDTINVQLYASHPEGKSFTFAAVGLPDGLSLDANTGLITGKLSYVSSGVHKVSVTAQDSNGAKDTKFFTWTVTDISYTLTINIVGDGSVSRSLIRSSYDPGTVIILTAVPANGWNFTGWSGDLNGTTNPESILLNGNKSITVTFTQAAAALAYAVHDDSTNNTQLFTINTKTFVSTPLGSKQTGYDIEALDMQPVTGLLYATSGGSNTHGKRGYLFTVDKQTGALTSIGYTGYSSVPGLSFKLDGTLWGWASGKGLIQIDLATGKGTMKFKSSLKVGDIAWSNDGKTLYIVTTDKRLYKYNPATNILKRITDTLSLNVESLDMRQDGLLIMGIHGSTQLKAFDPIKARFVRSQYIKTPYSDVEGIAWP